MRASVVVALLLPAVAAGASDLPGPEARFLGWNPDSTDFAYVVTAMRGGRVHEGWFLKGVSKGGIATPSSCRGPVRDRVKMLHYVTNEVRGQRLSPYVQAFLVGDGRTLRVALEVGPRRLTWSVWLDDAARPGESQRLLRGYFDELWTDLAARVFLAPDRRWAAVLVEVSTSYRRDTQVAGVRLGGGAP